jgi:hypothetical protein
MPFGVVEEGMIWDEYERKSGKCKRHKENVELKRKIKGRKYVKKAHMSLLWGKLSYSYAGRMGEFASGR